MSEMCSKLYCNLMNLEEEGKIEQYEQNKIHNDPIIEKKKNMEKLILLNKKRDDMKIDLVKEITKRKKIEVKLEKKTNENKNDEDKNYRKNLRKKT